MQIMHEGGIFLNDRAVVLLEQYDVEVSRTYKGRERIIFETNQGNYALMEYKGRTQKLELMEKMQEHIGTLMGNDMLLRNKEGELFTKDMDGTVYIAKKHIEGRECNYKSEAEVLLAFEMMAKLHCAMAEVKDEKMQELPVFDYVEEMQKHTRECVHVRRYIRNKGQKTEFEREILKQYDYFLEQAQDVTRRAQQEDIELYKERVYQENLFYHGDYQYHNVLFARDGISVVNFEKFGRGSGVRDIYLLFRKISEKNDWALAFGRRMLEAYEKHRKLSSWEKVQLYERLSYPDKFWKIVNFYANTRKSWIPDKNLEKLEQIVRQEKAKQGLLKTLF